MEIEWRQLRGFNLSAESLDVILVPQQAKLSDVLLPILSLAKQCFAVGTMKGFKTTLLTFLSLPA